LKCEKCGYVSFESNLTCPSCNKDLTTVRNRLGVHYTEPEMGLEEFFLGGTGGVAATSTGKTPQVSASGTHQEAELDLDSVGDEFEFTLDD
jgi:hypothetical protein